MKGELQKMVEDLEKTQLELDKLIQESDNISQFEVGLLAGLEMTDIEDMEEIEESCERSEDPESSPTMRFPDGHFDLEIVIEEAKVEDEACYITDRVSERSFEGCNQGHILKFDKNTTVNQVGEEEKSSSNNGKGKLTCKRGIL
ncbi:hypothetical protein SUGI_0466170 [Cryptomeria japonica]|nr:hypothetical protein SUGI_0466170 [Cryptomeria japonica]